MMAPAFHVAQETAVWPPPPPLRKLLLDADPDERLIRVIQRDVIERGRTAEAVMERYVRVLKPMHLEFIEPAKRIADLIVPQGGHNEKAIEILKMYIERIVDK